MRVPAPPPSNPFHDLDPEEVKRTFAEQAEVAAIASEQVDAIGELAPPRTLDGPLWLLLPFATVLVITLPFWLLPALHGYRYYVTIAGMVAWGWRVARRSRRRVARR